MIPLYVLLSAPLVRARRIPLLLWFTHWKRSRTLEAAALAATRIVSVDRRSFPIDSPKVRAIGHGIDVSEFPCVEPEPNSTLRLLVLGRYSPAKGIPTILRAVGQARSAGLDVDVELHGPASNELERAHRSELERLGFPIGDAVARPELPSLFARSDALVNNMEAGAPDKVVYEAAASCLPVLASNPVFDELFEGHELLFQRDDPASLVERLRLARGPRDPRAEGARAVAAGARRPQPLRRHVGGRHHRGGPRDMKPTVLHLQKVAGISGSEAHLLALLPRLKERGWDIRFLMLHEHEAGAWDFARELSARGIPLDAIPLAADVDPVAFVRIIGYLGRRRPTILHTHLVHADVYGQLTGAATGVPVRISTKHGFNEFRENRGFALGDRAIATLAHAHIAISRGLARYLADVEGFDGGSFEIVHYGIEPNGVPRPFAADEPRLLCVGRLIPIKGHIVLLRALAEARKHVPGLRLDIAGRGPLEPALRALAKELELQDAVRFLGHVAPIQGAIEGAAVVVVPSLGEGFGMVALEAMERARPVIAAEIGGLGELVDDGVTGMLVPPGDADALAAAIIRLAGDLPAAEAMGEAGRRRALDHFLQERCTDRTELLYRAQLQARFGRNGGGNGLSRSPV